MFSLVTLIQQVLCSDTNTL